MVRSQLPLPKFGTHGKIDRVLRHGPPFDTYKVSGGTLPGSSGLLVGPAVELHCGESLAPQICLAQLAERMPGPSLTYR